METIARHAQICDGCNREIKESNAQLGQPPIPLSHDSPISADMVDWRDAENPQKRQHHFHSESCMMACLAKRAKDMEESKASLDQIQLKSQGSNIYWDVNLLPSDGRHISYKERNSPKEWFIDEKRKSFPVMNCKDVSAVMHRIGTYKGEMSTEEIRSKLKRRASELGCTNSLPEADKNKD